MLTFAIGDIHGSYTKLVNLYRHCLEYGGARECRFVFLGDYVDRGKRSRDVVEFLIRAQATAPERTICLRGNHEAMLLDAVERGDQQLWLYNGGDATLHSYRVSHARELPSEHLAWICALPFSHADQKRFYVHAGVEPGVPPEQQAEHSMLWIREPFLSDPSDHGTFVVHGHTPCRSLLPDLRPNRLNLDTGACFGGPLTAAVFDEKWTGPVAFITDDGRTTRAPALSELEDA